MLWELEVWPAAHQDDRAAAEVLSASRDLGISSVRNISASRSFLIQTDADADLVADTAGRLLVDELVEDHVLREIGSEENGSDDPNS